MAAKIRLQIRGPFRHSREEAEKDLLYLKKNFEWINPGIVSLHLCDHIEYQADIYIMGPEK